MPKHNTLTATKRSVSHIMPRDTLSLIPVSSAAKKTEKNKREREWERAFKPVSFYIPAHSHERVTKLGGLRDTLRAIANRELVKVDDIAREFTDYGLHAYTSGVLKITASPKAQSKKLHVDFEANTIQWQTVPRPDPANVTFDIAPRTSNELKSKRQLVVLSYRWGADSNLYKQILDIADKHGAYPGDIAVLLLEFSIQHYLENRMQLAIRPSMEKMVVGWSKRGK